MQGKTRGVVKAYAWPLVWVLAGFALAELLRLGAQQSATRWPAALGAWVSLLGIVAATVRACWVSWRLWRSHGPDAGVPPPPDGAA